MTDPLAALGRWLDEATRAGAPHPWSAVFVTATPDGAPSARTVTLKRLEPTSLIFTSALWTRKVAELRANPQVAVAFHWPSLGRQVLVEGDAVEAEAELSDALFAERDRAHQLQALASRQGQEIAELADVRHRLDALTRELSRSPVPRPDDWGAIRVTPRAVELWEEARDRLHSRMLHRLDGTTWTTVRLSP